MTRTTRRLGRTLALLLVLSACASAPPTLSPSGVAAFHATRVVKALDLLRDAAVAANGQTPPILSTATTRKVVVYHRSAVLTIGQVPSGWAPVVTAGLTELVRDLAPPERARLAPYVSLLQALIAEVAHG